MNCYISEASKKILSTLELFLMNLNKTHNNERETITTGLKRTDLTKCEKLNFNQQAGLLRSRQKRLVLLFQQHKRLSTIQKTTGKKAKGTRAKKNTPSVRDATPRKGADIDVGRQNKPSTAVNKATGKHHLQPPSSEELQTANRNLASRNKGEKGPPGKQLVELKSLPTKRSPPCDEVAFDSMDRRKVLDDPGFSDNKQNAKPKSRFQVPSKSSTAFNVDKMAGVTGATTDPMQDVKVLPSPTYIRNGRVPVGETSTAVTDPKYVYQPRRSHSTEHVSEKEGTPTLSSSSQWKGRGSISTDLQGSAAEQNKVATSIPMLWQGTQSNSAEKLPGQSATIFQPQQNQANWFTIRPANDTSSLPTSAVVYQITQSELVKVAPSPMTKTVQEITPKTGSATYSYKTCDKDVEECRNRTTSAPTRIIPSGNVSFPNGESSGESAVNMNVSTSQIAAPAKINIHDVFQASRKVGCDKVILTS